MGLAAVAIICAAAVIGWVAAEPDPAEQTTAETFEPEPLVINTVERLPEAGKKEI